MQNPSSQQPPRPLSRGRELEREQQTARLVFGRLGCWGRLPRFGECPLPNPPPRGREQVAVDFAVAGDLKGNLSLQPLITGRLKSKKAACTTCFLAEPLTRTATPSSLPWERVRERAASRKACIGAVRCSERLPKFGECPLPNPPPRGRERVAADSGVAGRLKKNARNINSGNFSGSLYRKAGGTNAASVFSDNL